MDEKSSKETKPKSLSSSEVNTKIDAYEHFINDVLKKDLRDVENVLKDRANQYREWKDVRHMVTVLKEFSEKDCDMNIQVDIGCNVRAQATVSDYERIYVDIGLGIMLEMDRDEAEKYSDIRLRGLEREIDHFRQSAAKIKAHIKISLLALHELMNV